LELVEFLERNSPKHMFIEIGVVAFM